MISVLLFVSMYVSTYLGFFLGKVTKHEKAELKIAIFTLSNIFQLILYLVLLYYFTGYILILFAISFAIFIYSITSMNMLAEYFHSILLYTISFVLFSRLDSDLVFYSLLSILAMLMNASRRELNLRLEIFGAVILFFFLIIMVIL